MSPFISVTELVDRTPALELALGYDAESLRELNQLDQIETLFHEPLSSILERLSRRISSGSPPGEVTACATRAEAMQVDAASTRVDARGLIRRAIAHVYLGDLLSSRSAREREATLNPPAGTRFVDWATWVDSTCDGETAGLVLAALAAYRDDYPDAAPSPLRESGLVDAVRTWMSPARATEPQ